MTYRIGIDIGGTKISFVLLKGVRVVKKRKIFTPKTKKEIIKKLEGNIENFFFNIPKREISGIGIGVPGPLNIQTNTILNPPNLISLRNCPLARIIERRSGIKTEMDNDVNCFTLAEAILGAGRGKRVVFGVTLGTGVGGGIVINKRIYQGAFGGAGEVGHTIINFDGPRCNCGNYGCLEEYCSERFIKRRTGLTPQELRKRAREGDKKAIEVFQELGKFLGIGLANVVNILSPEIIIIGGGISRAGNLIFRSARKTMRDYILSPTAKKNVKIKKARLGDFSGAIGAALLIK